jgi:Cellulase (glycosyl hydrolase family 5)
MTMRTTRKMLRRVGWICAAIVMAWGPAQNAHGALETVRIGPDGREFVLARSGKSFRVWGVNYDHDAVGGGRLIEDYWEKEWSVVQEDFREIRELGANVVRIHLQLGRFMLETNKADRKALSRLRKLLKLAESNRLYLDLTGLGCYHKKDVPPWYDALDEAGRWEVQANFWKAVARACRRSPAVFCYDLMNEPIVGGNESEGWLAGELGGKHFVQRLTLQTKGRTSHEIAAAWVKKLTDVIRREDPNHLITVGAIPWSMVWPNAKPVLYGPEAARYLDFVSIHVYPKKGEVDKAIEAMKVYDLGKPLLIEEFFPLECSMEEMDEFLQQSRVVAEGWVSFYWGKTVRDYESAKRPGPIEALMARWLRYFQEQAPSFRLP